jgi:hypothetical protein
MMNSFRASARLDARENEGLARRLSQHQSSGWANGAASLAKI